MNKPGEVPEVVEYDESRLALGGDGVLVPPGHRVRHVDAEGPGPDRWLTPEVAAVTESANSGGVAVKVL